MSEQAKLNIHQRMLKATDEIERVVKGLKVDSGNGKSYKAVSEVDVLEAVKPVEIVNGIYSYPIHRTITETAVLTKSSGANWQFMRIETVYRFVNIDDPKDYVEVITYGDGLDSGDKAPGKAMTYADKYALLKAYKIETGDDPDKEASGEYEVKSQKKTYTPRMIELSQKETIIAIYKTRLQELLDVKGLKSIDEMTFDQAEMVLKAVSDKVKK